VPYRRLIESSEIQTTKHGCVNTSHSLVGAMTRTKFSPLGIANSAFTETPAANKGRLLAVDTARLLAIFGVICVHTRPFGVEHLPGYSPHWHLLYSAISIGSRSAVPFFFCVSGYFWGRKVRSGTSAKTVSVNMLKRLTAVFLFWVVAYFLLNKFLLIAQPWVPMELGADATQRISIMWHPLAILHGGTAEPLWFLPALFCAVALTWLLVSFKRNDILLAVPITLYVIGVLARAYSHSSIGLNLLIAGRHIDTRDGPFFGTLFFVTGYLLSKYLPRPQWVRWGLVLLVAGVFLHRVELLLIHTFLHAEPVAHYLQDYVFTTYAAGLGATMLALAGPRWLANETLARWGHRALGIYCVHYAFCEILASSVAMFHSPVTEVAFPLVVLLLSMVSVSFLSKLKLTRRFVQ
jgi:surface polysaccharide O-acyltransferase-like enzyme